MIPYKRLTLLPLLMLLLLTACGREALLMRKLEQISKLSETDADSAKSCIVGMRRDVTEASPNVRAYYNLVLTKVRDKSLESHTSDSVINAVRAYYEENFDEAHLPEAYYYSGRVNFDLGQVDKTIFFYHKALYCDSAYLTNRLRSRIYAQLGYIYLRNRLYEDAVSMQQMAHCYCMADGDTLGMRYTTEDIATITAMMQVDTVVSAQKMALQQKIHRLMERAQAQTLMRKKDQQEALSRQSVSELRHTLFILLGAFVLLILLALAFFLYRRKRAGATPVKADQKAPESTSHRPFYDNDLDQLFRSRLKAEKVLTAEDIQLVESRIQQSFPTFRRQLFQLYDFSEMEYHICLLIKCQQSPSNMARLLATANSTISQSRLRMQQKVFGGKGGAKDWDRYILNLE